MQVEYPLLHYLSSIRRARGGYLYTEKGQRILDVWLQNGTIINGHQTHTLLNVAKNSLSRTFFAQYPNIWHDKVLRLYARHFGACHAIVAMENHPYDKQFHEPWQNNSNGYYLLRANCNIPSDIVIGKVMLPLHGYGLYLFFAKAKETQHLASTTLPAYLAQVLLRELTHFSPSPADLNGIAEMFVRHSNYFQWKGSEDDYEVYFLEALSQNILLPPHYDATGLWLPNLFSPKQNILISSFIK